MEFNKQQKEVINTIDGNMVVVASAGSGKTTVLTHRIKNMIVNYDCSPTSILAVTFSKKAKESIIDRLRQLDIIGVNVETFHSLALKIIQSEYGTRYYTVWTQQWEREKVIQNICTSLRLCSQKDIPYNDIISFIAKQKNLMLGPYDNLEYDDDQPFSNLSMKQIYQLYEKAKSDRSYIEFDDFLNIANKILDTDHIILQTYRNKFQYVLVDEFQDVSLSQSLLLEKLNSNNTMIVGDPLQAIYAFRGGDSKYILNFDVDYPDVKVVNLNMNYRCSKDIILTANMLASSIPDSKHRNYVESIAFKDAYKKPELYHFQKPKKEGEWISKKIKSLIEEGCCYDDIAILARTNAQLQILETILHKATVPFDVVDNAIFTELPEIKLILSYLRLALHENDNAAFSYLYNKPNRWLDKKFLEEVKHNSVKKNISMYQSMFSIDRRNWRFKNGIDEVHEVINYLQNKKFKSVVYMVKYLRARLDIDSFVTKGKQSDDGKYDEQIENLDNFETICQDYSSIEGLLNYLEELNNNTSSQKEKVKLLTIHKSKGLEFPVVFITGCNDGLLPHSKSDDLDDERRLMYVAITRAEKELYLTYTDYYNNQFLPVSPFIEDLKNTIVIHNQKSKDKL